MLWTQDVFVCAEIHWPLLLPFTNYRNKLTDEKLIRMSGIAKDEETGRSMLVVKDLCLEPPHLSIEVRSWQRWGLRALCLIQHRSWGMAANKTLSCPRHQSDGY